MVRVICPNCQSKLDARDDLIGQIRNCPKCKNPVRIVPSDAEEQAPPQLETEPAATTASDTPPDNAPAVSEASAPHGVPPHLERLGRTCRYLICDRQRVIAAWENNGSGWQVHTPKGFAAVSRNNAGLPTEGDFKLIELRITPAGDRIHLSGLWVYQLARRWALQNLVRGDDAILGAVSGPGSLTRDQKLGIRNHLKSIFMPEVWNDATAVREYLTNFDTHSHGAGNAATP